MGWYFVTKRCDTKEGIDNIVSMKLKLSMIPS